MKESQCLAEFYKSDIVETCEIETSTDFLNFADVNFKLIALKFRTIVFEKSKSRLIGFFERPGFRFRVDRGSSAHRGGRVFSKRKDPKHTLFCRKTLVLSRFTSFLKGFHGAFGELSTKVSFLSQCFQQKSSCFWGAFDKCTILLQHQNNLQPKTAHFF